MRCNNSARQKSLTKPNTSSKNCFTRLSNNNDSLLSSTTTYFTPTATATAIVHHQHHHLTPTLVTNEYALDEEENGEDDYECSENSAEIYHGIKCCCPPPPPLSKRSGYESYNGGHDLASVSVSRSIQKLTLHVYVYFNIASENEYVSNWLLPCLKRCLSLVPDTKYILKPQLTPWMTTLDAENASHPVNILSAHVLVLSDEFHGYRQPDFALSGTSSNRTGSTSAGSTTDYMSYRATTKAYRQSGADAETLRHAFKIYLSLDNAIRTQNELKNANATTATTTTLNSKLIRKIYETTIKSAKTSRLSTLATRDSLQISGDMFSSFAYSDKLQFKLEKYLEHVCLKSHSFSNANFSYVDYTKR